MDAVKEICWQHDFMKLYIDKDNYKLPPKINQEFANLFSKWSDSCSHLLAGVKKIKKDSFITNIAYMITETNPYGYESIARRYSRVVYDSEDLVNLLKDEIRKIEEE